MGEVQEQTNLYWNPCVQWVHSPLQSWDGKNKNSQTHFSFSSFCWHILKALMTCYLSIEFMDFRQSMCIYNCHVTHPQKVSFPFDHYCLFSNVFMYRKYCKASWLQCSIFSDILESQPPTGVRGFRVAIHTIFCSAMVSWAPGDLLAMGMRRKEGWEC